MKVPAAINAMEQAGIKSGTEKGDTISLIAVCTSAFVTTLIVARGMAFLAPVFEPVYNNPVIQPAFQNVIPALYGALLIPYVLKAPKDSVIPIVVVIATLLIGGRTFYGNNQPYLSIVFILAAVVGSYFIHKEELHQKNVNEDKS